MPIKLAVPTQCHEDWDGMQPNRDGRHCFSCQKTVVDFSGMTDKEILDYISHAHGSICGRLNNGQLNRRLQENNLRRRLSWRYIYNLLIVLFVFAGKAKAQGKIKYTGHMVKGVVKNAMTGEPVPFASVMIAGSKNGVSADSAGNFSLEVLDDAVKLEVSAAGFETATTDMNEGAINLSPIAKEMDKVEIIGYGATRCRMISGAIAIVEEASIYEKITRPFKKDIVVFPNPVTAGNSVQVSVALQEKGEYRVDLIDGSGRVLWMKTVNITEPKFNLSIPTQSSWSAGVYWVRMTGRRTRKIHNGKILLQ